jgi:hypothetical protein
LAFRARRTCQTHVPARDVAWSTDPSTGRTILRAPARSPGSAKQFRHVERHIVEQKTLVSNSFRRPESESMPVAEGGETPCLTRLARPGTGESSLEHCQQAHRLAVVTVAFAQHRGGPRSRDRQNLHSDFVRIRRHHLVARLTYTISVPDVLPWEGISQPSRAVADVP